MKIWSVLLLLGVLVMIIGFSSATTCVGGRGTTIDGSESYCNENNLVTDSCLGDSAFRESKVSCQFGCDATNLRCNPDSFAGITAKRPEGAINQEIKCLFSSSNSPQLCSYKDFKCSGTDSCYLAMYGMPGENISLTGSCAGNPRVTLDGTQKVVGFDCKGQLIGSENVTCIFKDATKEEKCFSGNYSCVGNGNCSVGVSGKIGDKFVWKSSCGGEDSTEIDMGNQKGGNGYALFYCGSGEEQIQAYSLAYAMCYDGFDLYKGTSDDCKTEESWRYAMDAACDGRCRGTSDCGIKRFKAFSPCGNITFVRPTGADAVSLDNNSQCQGCEKDGKCYAFGNRENGDYCFYDGSIKNYSVVGESCEKDYQCQSNSCNNGTCTPNGIFEKISIWFKGLFKK